jgi:hypothetical protein
MGRSRASVYRLASVGPTVLLCLLGYGCRGGDPAGGKGTLAIPPRDSVRIVSRKIEQTPDRLHYKWSVIGERNWIEARAAAGQLSLAKTYPLNTTSQRGGCNIWECDLTAERDAAAATVRWTTLLHGSIGTTVRDAGTAPDAGGGPTSVVRVDLDRDTVERLSADLTLAHVGDTPIRLRIER